MTADSGILARRKGDEIGIPSTRTNHMRRHRVTTLKRRACRRKAERRTIPNPKKSGKVSRRFREQDRKPRKKRSESELRKKGCQVSPIREWGTGARQAERIERTSLIRQGKSRLKEGKKKLKRC